MIKLPVSIIVPVRDDERIFRCIDSIDAIADIIVILNGNYSKVIEKKLKYRKNIRLFYLDKLNFSKIYNLGIEKAKEEFIFYMDSDCVLKKGALLRLFGHTAKCPIVKGNIKFSYNNFLQKIIAKNREFTTIDSPNLFIPGPIFKKAVFKRVGLFNEEILHCADFEMAQRIEHFNIKWLYFPEIVIVHEPLSLKQDLLSAYRYGLGRFQRYKALKTKRNKSFLKETLSKFLACRKSKGLIVALYCILWLGVLEVGNFVSELNMVGKMRLVMLI